jgi:hypothetical protein
MLNASQAISTHDTNDRMSQNCQVIALEEYLLKLQTQR